MQALYTGPPPAICPSWVAVQRCLPHLGHSQRPGRQSLISPNKDMRGQLTWCCPLHHPRWVWLHCSLASTLPHQAAPHTPATAEAAHARGQMGSHTGSCSPAPWQHCEEGRGRGKGARWQGQVLCPGLSLWALVSAKARTPVTGAAGQGVAARLAGAGWGDPEPREGQWLSAS